MVIKLGLIGLSEGNGHPYSFGAIINGFNKEHLRQSGWDVIYNYINKRDMSEIGINNALITHVWTQEPAITKNLALACNIKNMVDDYLDMLGQIDGVIIARDDYQNHLKIAKPFLESGIKVFIDKPLTLNKDELLYFMPFIKRGQLLSMSGMRFAQELDDLRSNLEQYGTLKFIQSTVINDWKKYGIHIIDAVLGVIPFYPMSIEYISSNNGLYVIEFENNLSWTINTLENVPKTFNINVWGTSKRSTFEINDNFSMFRRLLWKFIRSIEEEGKYYEPKDAFGSICLLIGGEISRVEGRKVFMEEFSDILQSNE